MTNNLLFLEREIINPEKPTFMIAGFNQWANAGNQAAAMLRTKLRTVLGEMLGTILGTQLRTVLGINRALLNSQYSTCRQATIIVTAQMDYTLLINFQVLNTQNGKMPLLLLLCS